MTSPEAAVRAVLLVWFTALAIVTFMGFVLGDHAWNPVMLIAHECALIGVALSLFVHRRIVSQ